MHTDKQAETRKPNYARKIGRIVLKSILFLMLFIVVVFLLVLTPPVQKFLTAKAENFLQNKLKTRVEIGGVSFGLSGRVHLKDIYLEDRTKDTLLSGGTIKANVTLLKLFSNEVEIKDVALENVTAKIKRVLPDTAFNFQFIVDAFVTENNKQTDTAQTAPLKLNVYNLDLTNINLVYQDVITGNDMRARIGNFTAKIDSLDLEKLHYSIPLIEASDITARIFQTKPLVSNPEPLSTDMAQAAEPITMKLNLGEIDLSKINLQYGNDVSAFYTQLSLGELRTEGKNIDLQNQVLHLSELKLNNTTTAIRMGNEQQAKALGKEIGQEVKAQTTQKSWSIRVDDLQLNNNDIRFDDNTKPRLAHGMDYAHLNGSGLTLHVKNLIFNSDSIGGQITRGSLREKSGFQLDALRADLLYAYNQSYIKDLYLKTPGTELKREVLLTYSSYQALADSFQNTQLEVDIPDSRIQVKDILVFAPQLRSQAAFSNPNDIWHLNINANGNMDRLHIAALEFEGLKNTVVDIEGTLASLTNPNAAGGTLTIRRLHTSQSDIALFTGQRLSNAQMNLPETFDLRGTVAGNMSKLNTNLILNTSAGGLAVVGRFGNLTNPKTATYNASIRTSGFKIGSILRNPQMGALSGSFAASGSGFTPDAMNARFRGSIFSFGFNNYTYRNVDLSGSLNRSNLTANVNSKDPNAFLNLTATGNLSNNPSFRVNGFIDSLKTLPLHFTAQPLIFRGKIDADIPTADPNNLEANVLITKALFVSGTNRLPLDTVQLVSGRSDTGQYIRLTSDVASAQLSGQYRLTDMGSIIQNTIQPYFSVTPYTPVASVQPYNISFTADLVYSPVLAAFVPGLKSLEPVHAEGRLATGQGMQAVVTSSHILFSANEINDLNLKVNTADSGLQINGSIARLKSGNSFDLYNTQVNASVLNNIINFNLGIDDQNANDKYILSGMITQPSPGNMTFSLRPDNLLLNYDRWTIAPNNSISIINNQIIANNFILQKGNQQLSLQSAGTSGNVPLNVSFTNFRLGTITGFIKSDSLLVDGAMNGTINLQNLMTQPVFTSNLTISDLSFKKDTIGNINLQVASAGSRYNTNMTLTGHGNDLALTGSFAPQGNDLALDLDLAIRRVELNTLEGALATFIKSASGAINGNVSINGTSAAPKVQGNINFDNAVITTSVIGGPLSINNEKLSVTENGFVFDNFSIRDSANQALTLNGNVATTNFINYAFSLDVDARNFRALNTTQKDNKIYFGQLYLSTNLHIAGTEQKPIVDGSLSIEDKTNFSIVIPQAEPGVVEREGVVVFTDFESPENDSLFLAYDSLNVSNLLGFDISTNIELKKEAIFNVIVDVANGDFLNLRGAGQLSAGIDPSGKISLTGSYEIEEGAYQLSFNFLKRKFEIEKGSKLVWMGEPTNAQVDVTAVYVANTAPLDLVEDQVEQAQRNYYLQKLPFNVLLKLDGELMKPLITFDVVLPSDRNYNVGGDVITNVNTRLTQLRQEPSELNKQVFAVLLLNRFVGQNPFQSSSGGGFNAGSLARQSVSKLLTEQLNGLAGGLVAGVDVNFDVASSDDYTTGERRSRTDLNVGLSKRLLNDRLTVTVGSNFQLEGPQQSNQGSNNIAGNVAINYQLSKDGRYMLRFYRKNDYEGQVDGYVIETGLGFIMTVDYNRFREILHAKKVRAEREARRQANNQNPQQQ